MVKANPKIIVILGQTASGKSDLAIQIAQKYNGEIISADSRQVYRGMDLGTGKLARDPEKSDDNGAGKKQDIRNNNLFISGGVKHYLIDILNPGTEYNVSHFKKEAEKIIADILQRDKLPIICGGTGFWISAVVDNKVFPEVKPNKKLREKLAKKSVEQLFLMLKKLDPERAKNIDAKNKVRLTRALEICKALGKVPEQKTRNKKQETNGYEFLQIGIDVTREKLYRNIRFRLEKRFKAGLIKEVENLHKKYNLSWKKIQSFGLVYYWIPLYFQNKIMKDELLEKVWQAEKDYAKRQMTWFKRNKNIRWIKNKQEAEKEVKKFIK